MIPDTITIFCITTYCILKATFYSGIKESGGASDGEKWLGRNIVKGLETFALFAVQLNAVVDSKSQQHPNIGTGKDPSH